MHYSELGLNSEGTKGKKRSKGISPSHVLMEMSCQCERVRKTMQLDVDVSPPANIMTLTLGLTYSTFDIDPHDL